MQASSIPPFLVLSAAFVCLGALICAIWPFYRDATSPGGHTKVDSLDGLRGFLAIGVFFHHGYCSYNQRGTGVWGFAGSHFYALIGPVAVKMFFMITGFLFWTKAIRSGARLPPGKLLFGRIMRIGPMYLFVSLIAYVTLFVERGFQTRDTPGSLALSLASPFTLGLFWWRPIDGFNPMDVNAGVTWTLQYEWGYYLALPALALLATPRGFAIILLLTVAILPWAKEALAYALSMNFLIGMAVAHSLQTFGAIRPLASWPASLICLGLLALIPLSDAYGFHFPAILALSVVFLCLVHGNSLFGALTNRGAKMLGTVSYSLYLLHGCVIYLGWKAFDHWIGLGMPTPEGYWAFVAACGVISILFSALTYRYVEHPFISMGHRIGRTPRDNFPQSPGETGLRRPA